MQTTLVISKPNFISFQFTYIEMIGRLGSSVGRAED
ncbi:uncharacterized protein METZ01_LOCUS169246 [marine metagenome]|uniref:Uncharacterized protein n=1 Tax=marine metagenome TaxID=408172 RepID=A0A382BSI7_9ZZZZ